MPASRPPANPLGQPPAAAHRSPVTLQDLLDDLLWPHMLRSWKLALAPGRVALCFLLVLVIGCLALLSTIGKQQPLSELIKKVQEDLGKILNVIEDGPSAAKAVFNLFVELPAEFLWHHPVVALVCMPLILLAWCTVGGSVCRSCACEVSLRAALPWRQAIAFGVRKSLALFAALAGPLLMVWVACLLLRLIGYAFFTTKVLGVVGGLTFIFPLILCLMIAVAVVAYLVAHSLLIPAVACEGTDSFDAVQRCYAYVLARPGRIVGYMLISFFATVPAVVTVVLIGTVAITTAVAVTGAPGVPLDATLPQPFFPGGGEHWGFTKFMVLFWTGAIIAVGLSYFISLYFCAATNLYLVVRRLIDGQDITELWKPPAAAGPGIPTPTQPPSLPIPEKADYT